MDVRNYKFMNTILPESKVVLWSHISQYLNRVKYCCIYDFVVVFSYADGAPWKPCNPSHVAFLSIEKILPLYVQTQWQQWFQSCTHKWAKSTIRHCWNMVKYNTILNTVHSDKVELRSGLILGLRPANEKRRYFVKTSNWPGASLESPVRSDLEHTTDTPYLVYWE